jgi:hypothetical protein
LFADAEFVSSDPSACVFTDVKLSAFERRFKETGHPMPDSGMFIFISKFDVCTQRELLAAGGSAPPTAEEFEIDKKLKAATLHTTVDVTDFLSGRVFPVEISVSWKGIGATVRQKEHVHTNTPGFHINARFDGTFRDATASGIVSDGTTNFTPESAVSAEMRLLKNALVEVIH